MIEIRKGQSTQIVTKTEYDLNQRQEGWSIVRSVEDTAAPADVPGESEENLDEETEMIQASWSGKNDADED